MHSAKLLPSFVGSKTYWVGKLDAYLDGKPIAEPFAGSAALSMAYASEAIWGDTDFFLCKVLASYDQLIVPEVFTVGDFYRFRQEPDWWRWAFCLQSMAFSGVWRWRKNGYNVPAKKNKRTETRNRPAYEEALDRWTNLAPVVHNCSYNELPIPANYTVVCDPPYEGSQAAYNSTFSHDGYWEWVLGLMNAGNDLVIFDRLHNLQEVYIPVYDVRKMRVHGGYAGDAEAVAIYSDGDWVMPKV